MAPHLTTQATNVLLVVALFLACPVEAQQPGQGISKYTMAVSDPLTALDFAIKYFPVIDCRSSSNAQCNGTDTCGLIGRTNLCGSDACPQAMGPGSTLMFPHMINATARPYGSVSVADVEKQFDRKFKAAAMTKKYDSFLDFALVVYAKSLDRWLKPLATHEGPASFFPISWQDDTGKKWWSAIVQIPHTQVLVEMISDTKPSSSVVADSDYYVDSLVRLPATKACTQNPCSSGTEGMWVPLAVSKPVASLSEMTDFYTDVFKGFLGFNATAGAGAGATKLQMIYFNGYVNMQVRMIERPATDTLGAFKVSDLHKAKMEGHQVALGRTEEESALCGVSKWYDNHWGLDQHEYSYSDYLKAMEARNWTFYHMWSWNMYIIDPSGDGVQMDTMWGTYKPTWASLAEDDALQNLCTQGNCASAATVTTTSCAAALTAKCGKLNDGKHIADCNTCVHWAWSSLAKAGCYNPDAVKFCAGSSSSSSSSSSSAVTA